MLKDSCLSQKSFGKIRFFHILALLDTEIRGRLSRPFSSRRLPSRVAPGEILLYVPVIPIFCQCITLPRLTCSPIGERRTFCFWYIVTYILVHISSFDIVSKSSPEKTLFPENRDVTDVFKKGNDFFSFHVRVSLSLENSLFGFKFPLCCLLCRNYTADFIAENQPSREISKEV